MKAAPVKSAKVDDCWNRIGIWGDSSCGELTAHFHCRNCPVYASAAQRFFDSRPPAEYRREWTTHLAEDKRAETLGTRAVLIFRIGDVWLGMLASAVDEIAEIRPIHSLPHRKNPVLRGVVNVRGQLLVCLSLGNWFGIDRGEEERIESPSRTRERLLVTRASGERLVFPVSEVRGITYCELDNLSPTDRWNDTEMAPFCLGTIDWRQEQVVILSENSLFNAIEAKII